MEPERVCELIGHKTNKSENPKYYRGMPKNHPLYEERNRCQRCGRIVAAGEKLER